MIWRDSDGKSGHKNTSVLNEQMYDLTYRLNNHTNYQYFTVINYAYNWHKIAYARLKHTFDFVNAFDDVLFDLSK